MDFQVDLAEVEKRFGYHKATEETIHKHKKIRGLFIEVASMLNEILPESREKSLALTQLQEAAMYSNAAVACNEAPLDLNG